MAERNSISRMAMKAMGIFGGVQMIGIICSIVRTKLVALWIGPVGVGLFGLFNQALDMLNTATNLGIRQSSVRDISQAHENAAEQGHISRVITAVRRWSLWLGMAGVVFTIAMSPLLSEWTFGNSDHIWGFVALSVALLFVALTNGEHAVLQGLAKLKRLAHATMWGTIFGLVLSVPMFYYLGEDSVVPSIIAYAAGCLIFAWIFRDKDHAAAPLTHRQTFAIGKDFVKLGIYMTAGLFITTLMGYVFNAWPQCG